MRLSAIPRKKRCMQALSVFLSVVLVVSLAPFAWPVQQAQADEGADSAAVVLKGAPLLSLGESEPLAADAGSSPDYYATFWSDGTLRLQSDLSRNYPPSDGATLVERWECSESSTAVPWESKKQQIRSVYVQGTIAPVSTSLWFSGCPSLTSLDLSGLDTSKVTDQMLF